MRLVSRVLPFLSLVLLETALVPTAARGAQVASPANPVPNTSAPAAPLKLEITGVTVEGRGTKAEFALGNTIVTTVGKGNVERLETAKNPNNPVGLFLNGSFMKGIDAQPDTNAPDALVLHSSPIQVTSPPRATVGGTVALRPNGLLRKQPSLAASVL